jgi:molybdate transport system substrate-binding protein
MPSPSVGLGVSPQSKIMESKMPLQIITSGAFAAALQELAPAYCSKTGEKIELHFGSSHGAAHDSIPTRLSQGQRFDAFILARKALDSFAAKGYLAAGQGWDLVESNIAVAVRVDDPAPDISTLEAFKETMLAYKKVALSASASGIYLSTEVFPKLGIAEQMSKTAFTVFSERVGHVIARGEADIGIQQTSEIMPIKTVKIIGLLPPEIRQPFYFSAAIGADCSPDDRLSRTRAFLAFLASPAADDIIRSTGLEPLHPPITA